jgi:hypothetical protein
MLAGIIGALVNLLLLAFAAGRLHSNQEENRADINGLGIKCRGIETREDRRHKQMIAALLMNAKDDKEKERLASLLRDDSWS